MSEKVECPGCNAYSSTVLIAFNDGEPCPFCGLSAQAAAEILAVRETQASKALKLKYEEARVRADRAEEEVRRLRLMFIDVEDAVDRFRKGESGG